jgi:hypothetical protein
MPVLGGAMLMVGCAVAAWVGNLMFYRAFPGSAGLGRGWMVVPFLPLTAVAVLIAGVYWTRRVDQSIAESIGALLFLELIILGLVAAVVGMFFNQLVFLFWATISLAFAPPWLLSVFIGRAAMKRMRHV